MKRKTRFRFYYLRDRIENYFKYYTVQFFIRPYGLKVSDKFFEDLL